MNQKTKICGHCRTAKSIDEFYNNKGKKDGKSGYCKVCDKDMMHKRFAKSGKYRGIFKIWKQSEKEYLRMHYATAEMKDMVAFLGATPQKIRQMAVYIGMGGKRRENILEKARTAPKKKRVWVYKRKNGVAPRIKKEKQIRQKPDNSYVTWTDAEKEYLIANYEKTDMKVMVNFLNRRAETIRTKAQGIGLGMLRKEYFKKISTDKKENDRIIKAGNKIARLNRTRVKKDKGVINYHRELPRFVEKKFATKEVNAAELLPFKIDKKTTLYLPVNMPDEKRLEIITKYQSRKRA